MAAPFHLRLLDRINIFGDQETLLAVLGTVVLVLVTAIYLLWDDTKVSLERTIVLVGPSGAGKTSIFSQLAHGTHPPTHPSLTPSTSHFLLASPPDPKRPPHLPTPPARKFKIIDYPGHARLAGGLRKLLEKEVQGKKRVAVVFVVDGSTGGARDKDVGAVVDTLLPLLPYTQPPTPTPLLLLTSKLDLLPSSSSRSLSVPRLHTSLTRELNARRSAALAASSVSSGGGKIELLDGDDESTTKEASTSSLEVEEILTRGGAGGKWRWEDWKGVSWAGGWVGKVGEGKEKKRTVVKQEGGIESAAPLGEKDGEEIVHEDGLGELKEWLMALK